MNGGVVDMGRVRKALAELDKLVAEHPELCNRNGPKWADHLPELEKLTMGTPVKQRIKDYRARLRAKGYRSTTVYLSAAAHERLLRLSQQAGLSYGDLLGRALEQYVPPPIGQPEDDDAELVADAEAVLDRIERGEEKVWTFDEWQRRGDALGG